MSKFKKNEMTKCTSSVPDASERCDVSGIGAAPDAPQPWGWSLSAVMKAQVDGAALFIQQTTKLLQWLDRSNGNSGERRSPTTRRRRWSLSASLSFRQRWRAELCRSRRTGLAVLVQTQTYLPIRRSRRVSDKVDIPYSSTHLQWIFFLWEWFATELPALLEAIDGWQSDADSESQLPGDTTRPTAQAYGVQQRIAEAPAARWAQALCMINRWLLTTKSSDRYWSDNIAVNGMHTSCPKTIMQQ